MKILTGAQIARADRYTIENEPVEAINLMERAAEVIAQWICNNVDGECPLFFAVGKGNNGGDGLAVARMLFHAGYDCRVFMPLGREGLSPDCAFNLERLPEEVAVTEVLSPEELTDETVIVDALLGSGASAAKSSPRMEEAIQAINSLGCRVISIDLPSGMLTEFGNEGRTIVNASTTLAIGFPKLAQLLPQAGECCGEIHVLDIELDERFMDQEPTPYHFVDKQMVEPLIKPRAKFAHKGTCGHALLICGSRGMTGAAILATGGALRSGCGVVTLHLPEGERLALHASCPSALLSLDRGECFSMIPESWNDEIGAKYRAVGVGCGLGRRPESAEALCSLLPMLQGTATVLDADALNIIADSPQMKRSIPAGALLTPHPAELARLVGDWRDEQHKLALVREFAAAHHAVVVVKGAHTMVCTPLGECFFNATGTPAMAKGGCGDVLTGLLTGLLARGYDPLEAAVVGVWIHGRAGELGAEYYGAEAMNSSDITDFLAEAIKEFE